MLDRLLGPRRSYGTPQAALLTRLEIGEAGRNPPDEFVHYLNIAARPSFAVADHPWSVVVQIAYFFHCSYSYVMRLNLCTFT